MKRKLKLRATEYQKSQVHTYLNLKLLSASLSGWDRGIDKTYYFDEVVIVLSCKFESHLRHFFTCENSSVGRVRSYQGQDYGIKFRFRSTISQS